MTMISLKNQFIPTIIYVTKCDFLSYIFFITYVLQTEHFVLDEQKIDEEIFNKLLIL